jgi:hypothetical protein
MKLEFKNTTEKVVTENYPYGFKLKTTKTDWIEFNPKKGFRHVSQTVNPKTGRPNNPKKSTYYTVGILGLDENQHTKFWACGFNGEKEMQISYKHLAENFDKYTGLEMHFLYMEAFTYLKVHTKAMVIYSGADFEQIKPLIDKAVKMLVQAINAKGSVNLWNEILNSIDFEAIDKTRQPDFKPFQVKQVTLS